MTAVEAELEALAGRLRARVADGRYREAQDALAEYCGALGKSAAGLAPRAPDRRRLQEQWLSLLEETRRRVLAGRAHAGARLALLALTPKRPRFEDDGQLPRSTREWSG
jgi:hypothetical protein